MSEFRALVKAGRVVNVAKVNPDDVPKGLEDWLPCAREVAPDWLYDGAAFAAPPIPEKTDADIDAEADRKVRNQVGDAAPPELKAMFEVIADLVVAGGLANNKAQARALVAQRLKQYYADEVKGKRQAGRGE